MAWLLDLDFGYSPMFELDPHEPAIREDIAYGLSKGYWLDPAGQPKSGYQKSTRKVYDVFPILGANAVRQRFKDLVEEFEPGVHQFLPIALRDKKGNPIEDNFYIFNCMVAMDTVLLDQSGLEVEYVNSHRNPLVSFSTVHIPKLVLSKPAIAGHHIWTGHYITPPGSGVFVSEAFHKELKSRKIRHFRQQQLAEADVPWVAEEQVRPILDWEASHPVETWGHRPRLRQNVLDRRGRLEL